MSSPIIFFEKNYMDLSRDSASIAVTDPVATQTGQDFVSQMRDRKNFTGWGTIDSTDAANTTLVFNYGDQLPTTDVILIGHNFKNYTLEFWDSSTWNDLVTVTGNKATTTSHNFQSVVTSRIRLVVHGTFVADEDKLLAQFIATSRIGQFNRFPIIEDPTISKRRRTLSALSGKARVTQSLGAVSFSLSTNEEFDPSDIKIIERIFNRFEGFLVWLCGGNENQFRNLREGYRLQDIYFMQIANENVPQMIDGFYNRGTSVNIDLIEAL